MAKVPTGPIPEWHYSVVSDLTNVYALKSLLRAITPECTSSAAGPRGFVVPTEEYALVGRMLHLWQTRLYARLRPEDHKNEAERVALEDWLRGLLAREKARSGRGVGAQCRHCGRYFVGDVRCSPPDHEFCES